MVFSTTEAIMPFICTSQMSISTIPVHIVLYTEDADGKRRVEYTDTHLRDNETLF